MSRNNPAGQRVGLGVLIGELAARTGVSPRSLRYYEKQGMLVAERGANGYREYPESAVEAVIAARRLMAAGVCTQTIARMLPCLRVEGPEVVPCADLVRELAQERARLTAQVEEITRSVGLLDEVIAAAR